MNKGLIALAFGGLALGMTEFSMMGLLPDIAQNLRVDIPTAAHLIALYALGVMVGAPILVLFTGKYPPKKVLLFLMLLFFVFNGLFALAPGYHAIQLARFAAGLPHGAFFGVGSVVAARLAKRGKEAQAISIMFTGMTIANLVGVPMGTYIGHHYSWRVTYALISFLGLVTFVALYFWLPVIENKSGSNILGQLSFFGRWQSWLLIAIISIGTGGLFTWISYIAPMTLQISMLPPSQLPVIMVLVGGGMIVGNLLGGKLADSMSPTKAAIICLAAMAACLLVEHFIAHIFWMAYVMAFVTGAVSFSSSAPIQMMLIRNAAGAETLAAAAGQVSFNLGNTLGAYLGGIPIIMGYAYDTPVLVGVGMALIGAMLSFLFLKTAERSVQ